ncbi:MAG: DUF2007 domain-containing protein [Hyphomicrobiales bacterium]|nr:MAG: DUF2007 domain-containing protein [Hyphomicrobiales bacterium]
MEELLKTNDPVLISHVTALLEGAGLRHILLDQHMSILEGSLGILPKRILVDTDDMDAARELLVDSGLEAELTSSKEQDGA